jgi:hypothetical protein
MVVAKLSRTNTGRIEVKLFIIEDEAGLLPQIHNPIKSSARAIYPVGENVRVDSDV